MMETTSLVIHNQVSQMPTVATLSVLKTLKMWSKLTYAVNMLLRQTMMTKGSAGSGTREQTPIVTSEH